MSETTAGGILVTWPALIRYAGTALAVCGSLAGPIAAYYSIVGTANRLADRVDGIASRQAELAQRMELELKRVDHQSLERHQQQDARLNVLDAKAEAISTALAGIQPTLQNLTESVKEMRGEVRGLAGAASARVEVQAVQAPQPRGIPRAVDNIAPVPWSRR